MPSIKRNGLRKITIMGKTKKLIEACVERKPSFSILYWDNYNGTYMLLIC